MDGHHHKNELHVISLQAELNPTHLKKIKLNSDITRTLMFFDLL